MDRGSYAEVVLHGAATVQPPQPTAPLTAWCDWLYAALSVAGAALVAVVCVRRPALGDLLPGVLRAPLSRLTAAHSGHPSDYVAFIVCGMAILACLFAISFA